MLELALALDFSHRHWWSVFWSNIDKDGPGGCWLWKGKLNKAGYGQFKCMDFKTRYPHRIMYQLVHGMLPPWDNKTNDLDHLCRVPACCNPEHLELVTHRENLRRGETINARHAAKERCPRGHLYDRVGKNPQRYCSTCKREHHNKFKNRPCSVSGCDRKKILARGLCAMHYYRAKKAGSLPDKKRGLTK